MCVARGIERLEDEGVFHVEHKWLGDRPAIS